MKDIARLRINLRKLTSTNEIIEDDYEKDDVINNDPSNLNTNTISIKNSDTSKSMAIRMVDRIENNRGIKIDNVSAIYASKSSNGSHDNFIQSPHLRISNTLDIDRKSIEKDNGIVVITIDPDGHNGFKRFSKTPLSNIDGLINTYCIPE